MTRIFLRRAIFLITFLASLCTNALAQDSTKPFEFGVYAGVSLNSYTGSDIDGADMKVGFNAGVVGRYFFYKNLFGELSLGVATKGYTQNTNSSSGQYWNDRGANYDSEIKNDMTTYNLDIPLYIGYRFNFGDKSWLSLKAGPYITYALAGQLKSNGYITTYPDIHSSETEHLDEKVEIGDMDDFNKFGVGIGAGIGYNYRNFAISAIYQHGFTQLFEDKDTFEQNISLSLSYSF